MYTDCWEHIGTAIEWIRDLNPKSVLDVNAKSGQWGFVCRRQLGESLRLVAFGLSTCPVLYDEILINGDAERLIHNVGVFDLIILSDILEHLTRERAYSMLANAVSRSNNVLMVTPSEKWTPDEYGHRHRSVIKSRNIRAMFEMQRHAGFENAGRGYYMMLLAGHQPKVKGERA